eukprot:scaffold27435_cov31-Prasinocladus_malaysianus.AAC.3
MWLPWRLSSPGALASGVRLEGVSRAAYTQQLTGRHGSRYQSKAFISMSYDVLMRRKNIKALTYVCKTTHNARSRWLAAKLRGQRPSSGCMRSYLICASSRRPTTGHTCKPFTEPPYVATVKISTASERYMPWYRKRVWAGWAWFGYPCVFFTINPLETANPVFCV